VLIIENTIPVFQQLLFTDCPALTNNYFILLKLCLFCWKILIFLYFFLFPLQADLLSEEETDSDEENSTDLIQAMVSDCAILR